MRRSTLHRSVESTSSRRTPLSSMTLTGARSNMMLLVVTTLPPAASSSLSSNSSSSIVGEGAAGTTGLGAASKRRRCDSATSFTNQGAFQPSRGFSTSTPT